MAAQAGKAAPAMAIAGALVTAPQATHSAAAAAKPAATAATHQSVSAAKATLDSIITRDASGTGAAAEVAASAAQQSAATLRTAAKQQHTAAKALTHDTYYKVRSGDTLSKIASNYYHKANDWQWLYHENAKHISDPNLIYPGQSLFVPADPPANYTLPASAYKPRHAKHAVHESASHSDNDAVAASTSRSSPSSGRGSTSLSGRLGCSGLEQLWDDAGGNPADAVMAASIAMAESGGNQYALSPTNDYGYWQINASNGALATFNAYGNARSAIILSNDGSNWSAWTTYTSGAYAGRC